MHTEPLYDRRKILRENPSIDNQLINLLNKDTIWRIEDRNIILLNGPIDTLATDYVAREILEKNLKSEDKPNHIKMFVNSPGGSVYECFAIIDLMNAFPIPIWTYGLGCIASAALLIFMSGAKGNRYMFKNTSILSHQWWGSEEGKQHEIQAVQKENKNITKKFYRIYENATGLSKDEIAKTLLPPQDIWLTAKEALDLQVCDHLISKL